MIRIAPKFTPLHHGDEVFSRTEPTLAAGLTCKGCMQPDMPKTPNYGNINQQTLQAQSNLAPMQYALEAQFQPAYGDVALQTLNSILKGSPGGVQDYNYQITAIKPGYYDSRGNMVAKGTPGAVFRGKGEQFQASNSITTKPSEGMFALMQQQNAAQRAADIADVNQYGRQAHDAMLAANPESAILLAKLNRQANTELDSGSGLTPDEQRAMQQASRAAFAARGMGGTNAALGDELLKQFDLGQTLLRQRQAFAQSLIGSNQAVVGDPFMQILGRNSGAVNNAQQTQAQAGPTIFNPQAGLGMATSNYATQAQLAAASPSTLQNIGTLAGIGGNVAKMGAAAAMI